MENTAIQWATHTFNPWRCCTKVSTGCANCYADAMSGRNPKTLGVWGPGGTRVMAAESYWRQPVKWNKAAAGCSPADRPRVFCASLSDVFEDWQGVMVDASGQQLFEFGGWWLTDYDVPLGIELAVAGCPLSMSAVRRRLFRLIDSTPNLDWLILSKRPENMLNMMATLVYNPVHEHSQRQRVDCVPVGGRRGTGDRRPGTGLAGGEADGGPLERRDTNQSVQAGPGGNCDPVGILASQGDDRGASVLCDGSPAGVASYPRGHNSGVDDQPQERGQARQQAEQLGAGDDERESPPCPRRSEREPEPAQGIEAPENSHHRGRRPGNSPAQEPRPSSQRDRGSLRHEAQGRQRDLLPPDVDSRLIRPNLWLGTSIENRSVLHRIDALRAVPAAVRFLSVEPLLEDLGPINLAGISWIIVGGESGPHARPCDVEWIRSIVRQCREAGVPVFVKQLGARPESNSWAGSLRLPGLSDKKGGDMEEWPEDLRIREVPTHE